ncbi:class II aldolase/adducin family protein [Pigmentiphaga soli]|uniref:Class II aldolase/adducin family protein n=1 Tax=Pigmentiphaga soli TaxID=1007095 RepID=A0ABP8GGE7_9BURK
MPSPTASFELPAPSGFIRRQVDDDEWNARVDLAACFRLIAKYGMSDLTYNHVTSRVPGRHDQVLINPYGMLYSEIRASDLYKIDLEGREILKPEVPYDQNPAGFVIHGAVHAARPDVGCVIHTHTRAGMAVSAMKCGLLPLTQTAMRFYGRVSYHDFEGPAINLEERERLVANLGRTDAMILRNHGLLTCGRSVAEAFNNMYWLEMACKAQVDAMAAGTELNLPPESVARLTAELYTPGVRRTYGELEWPAMLRAVGREDASFRQ